MGSHTAGSPDPGRWTWKLMTSLALAEWWTPLTQAADRELVAQQDRAYEQARRRDLRRNPSAAEVTPTLVRDSAAEEPSSEEMRQARLLRFGLVPR